MKQKTKDLFIHIGNTIQHLREELTDGKEYGLQYDSRLYVILNEINSIIKEDKVER